MRVPVKESVVMGADCNKASMFIVERKNYRTANLPVVCRSEFGVVA